MTDCLEPFAAYLRVERRRGALTIARYGDIVETFLSHLSSDVIGTVTDASDVTRLHCLSFLRSPGKTSTEEPSPATWNQRRAALRSFFGYLLRHEVIQKDPTLDIDYQPVRSARPVPLSIDEFLDMRGVAERSSMWCRARNVAIVDTLYFTALRVNELVSLDIDQLDAVAYLFRNVLVKGGKLANVEFNDMVLSSLARMLDDRAARTPVTEGSLFLSKQRTRMCVRGVQQLVKSLAKRAGIRRDVTPHLLRHSNATEIVHLGYPITVPQRICNHASPRTTETYVHVRDGETRAALRDLGALISDRLVRRRALVPTAA